MIDGDLPDPLEQETVIHGAMHVPVRGHEIRSEEEDTDEAGKEPDRCLEGEKEVFHKPIEHGAWSMEQEKNLLFVSSYALCALPPAELKTHGSFS
jgi:hypothetical protein